MNAPEQVSVTSTQRAHFIGGSDAPKILGLSDFGTPVTVYFDKVGWAEPQAVDERREKLFARGRRMEPVVREMAKAEYGLKVVRMSLPKRPNRYVDPVVPYFAAEVDFEAIVTKKLHLAWPATQDIPLGTRVNCEVKTTHPFAAFKFGENLTDEVPIEYAAQGMWGLGVTRRKHCLFFVLVGADDLLAYRIDRDEDTLAAMRVKCQNFWTEHVLPRVPPDPMRLEDFRHLFAKDASTRIDASVEIAQKVRKWARLKDHVKNCEERIDALQFDLGCYLLGAQRMENPERVGKHEVVVDGKPAMTVLYIESQRLDQERLEKEQPEIVLAYRKTAKYFQFRKPYKRKA